MACYAALVHTLYELRSQPPEKIIGVILIVDKDKSNKNSLFK
jgi:hypothetical protein